MASAMMLKKQRYEQITKSSAVNSNPINVYPEYFVSSNNAGLARYPDNWNRQYKARISFRSKCQQRKQS